MIIQCTSCSRKFVVEDRDIPAEGRAVQCGFCSVTWHQKPIVSRSTSNIKKTKPSVSLDNKDAVSKTLPILKASDGKTYKFLGSQWAQILQNGKTGLFAKKIIGTELNKRIGRKVKSATKKRTRIKEFDPSAESSGLDHKLSKAHKTKEGLGFFGYIFLILLVTLSIIGVAKTFEDYFLNYYPESIYLFEILDEQIDFTIETFKNIIIIIKDLINSY